MAAGDTLCVFLPQNNEPPASAYATLDTRNSIPVLDFDGSTDEEAVFSGILPRHYGGGGITAYVHVMFSSATSGSARIQAAFEAGASQDHDSDGFAAFQSGGGSANGTSGVETVITVAFTDGAQMDNLAAGGAFRFKVRRDADGTSGTDDITTDMELISVELRETP
jgi:hypothetical protein